MLIVLNRITECQGEHREIRNLSQLEYLIIHRFGWNDLREYEANGIEPDAVGIATFYRTNPEAYRTTKGAMPYTFVIGRHGTIWQACELGVLTPHAARFNTCGIGIACLGDFRWLPPTDEQKRSVLELSAALVRFHPMRIEGHTDIPGAMKDPNKSCPGRCFDMVWLRSTVASTNDSLAGDALIRAGVSL